MKALNHMTPTVEHLEVIRVRFHRGGGTGHEDIYREVTAYYLDGELLLEQDPCPGGRSADAIDFDNKETS